MLVIKYKKVDRAKFISHLDMMTHMQRALRRCELNMEYSQGFNPHELMFFAPPAPLGLQSECEYCSVGTKDSSEGFMEKFNSLAPMGIECVFVKEAIKNPNLAGTVTFARYEMPYSEDIAKALENAFNQTEYILKTEKKGEVKLKDVRANMHSWKVENDMISLILALGNTTLRVDKFMESMGFNDTSKVRKMELYIGQGENLISVDSIL